MSYRTGNVAVAQGSKVVTGTGTLWSIAVTPGDEFVICDANLLPIGPRYEVASVDSNTQLTLVQTFQGTTASGLPYAVLNIVGNMTVPSFAQKLAIHYSKFQALIDQPNTTPVANSIPVADSTGKIAPGWLPDATTTAKGAVELATTAEAQAGTDATRAMTPAALLGAMLDFGFHPEGGKQAPADLNTLLTPGIYKGPGGAAGLANWPVYGEYGTVMVTRRDDSVTQFIYLTLPAYNTQIAVIRFFDGTSWTEFDLRKPRTLSVTSTDDATSATSAPLKSAGGCAVAKKGIFGDGIGVGNSSTVSPDVTGTSKTRKIQVFDASGVSIGYIQVYSG